MYIVTGYSFLNTLHLVTLKENSEDIEHILTGSLVIGFICYKIASLIPHSCGEVFDCLGITLSSVLFAYLLGLFLNSRIILKAYNFLKIRESGKKYLWDDVMDTSLSMIVNVYYGSLKYNGYLFSYESYSNSPNVVLASYILTSNDSIIEDNSQDKTKLIILDVGKSDKVEIIYKGESKICNDIGAFCKDRETAP